jgi:leader peptidase (prepilin peptidase) / N-methyltransferase
MGLGMIVPVLAGWISGWIVNYLSDVLPVTRRLTRPTCPQCGDVYPLAIYLTFGSCPNCHHRRPVRTWLVQAGMLVVSLYTWFRPNRMGYFLGMILLTYFATVTVIDLEHRLILHPTSVFGALFGLGLGAWLHGFVPTLLGGLAALAIMSVLYLLGVFFARIRASRLKATGRQTDDEEALGFGDVILAGVLGLILGWPFIWFGLLLGILLGGVIGVALILYWLLANRMEEKALMTFMPYGPFFIASVFLILFVPNSIQAVVPR